LVGEGRGSVDSNIAAAAEGIPYHEQIWIEWERANRSVVTDTFYGKKLMLLFKLLII
jgi:hypothetical protein